jgi:hypothetical protein
MAIINSAAVQAKRAAGKNGDTIAVFRANALIDFILGRTTQYLPTHDDHEDTDDTSEDMADDSEDMADDTSDHTTSNDTTADDTTADPACQGWVRPAVRSKSLPFLQGGETRDDPS